MTQRDILKNTSVQDDEIALNVSIPVAILLKLRRPLWQLVISLIIVLSFILYYYYNPNTHILLDKIDKSLYISYVGGLATIVTLFCSVSFGFLIVMFQQSSTERLSAYIEFKKTLREIHSWLTSIPAFKGKNICMDLVYELETFGPDELPKLDDIPAYHDYTEALISEVDGQNGSYYFLRSAYHFSYLELLLSKIGLTSIKLIITRMFLTTLLKGASIVAGIILFLFASIIWLSSNTLLFFLCGAIFFSIMIIMLFGELLHDVYRHIHEDTEFKMKNPGASPRVSKS